MINVAYLLVLIASTADRSPGCIGVLYLRSGGKLVTIGILILFWRNEVERYFRYSNSYVTRHSKCFLCSEWSVK